MPKPIHTQGRLGKKTLGSYTNPEQMSSRDHAIAAGYTSGSHIDHALNSNKRGPRVTATTHKHEAHQHEVHKAGNSPNALGTGMSHRAKVAHDVKTSQDSSVPVEQTNPSYYGR